MRRKWLAIAGASLVGLLAALFLGVILLYPQIGEWAIRNKVLPRLEAKLGRDVSIGQIAVTRGTAVLDDLVVAGARPDDPPLVRVPRVRVTFDFWATLKGEIDIARAIVEQARIHAARRPDGSDDLRDLARRLGFMRPDDDAGARPAAGLGRLRPELIIVKGASLSVRDQAGGVAVDLGRIDTEIPRAGAIEVRIADARGQTSFGPGAQAAALLVTTSLDDPIASARVQVVDGSVSAIEDISLSSINGTIQRGSEPGALRIGFAGSYGGSTEELWQARGTLAPEARTGKLHLAAERFALGRLASVLQGSALIDFEKTEVGARVDLSLHGGVVAFAGGFEVAGAHVYHRLLAEHPVRDIEVVGEVTGRFDSATRQLDIERGRAVSREVEYRLEGSLAMPGGIEPDTGLRRERARLQAAIRIPPVPCQTMLRGIPRELVKYLQGFKLAGRFATDLRVAIDWADLDATELVGSVGIHKCRVVGEPLGDHGLDRLLESFVHHVEVAVERWISIEIGPENPDFVPLWDVSLNLVNSLMTTEDSRFYEHDGFIVREFKSALIKNLKAGYFRYGASSITMQMVKNVVLYREKTLSRKLQELFLTWHIENKLDKDRIFEIYVNAIEFGPGIYGIGPAAQHYFGKHPRDLNAKEAAFFSSILPNPKKRYQQYCDNKLWRWAEKKIDRIVKLMHKRERLTDEEFEVAMATDLVFDRTAAPTRWECKKLIKEAIENARPTTPGWQPGDSQKADQAGRKRDRSKARPRRTKSRS